jgi:hypothetical protein
MIFKSKSIKQYSKMQEIISIKKIVIWNHKPFKKFKISKLVNLCKLKGKF